MFELISEPGRMCISMSATTPNIDEAETHLCEWLQKAAASVDEFAVRIIFREALLNAVIHGSRQDASQEVRLQAELRQSGLMLTVRDNGPGFPWRDMRQSMDILADAGRGIALMNIYASEVRFNDNGNEVTLRRKYESAPTAAIVEGE